VRHNELKNCVVSVYQVALESLFDHIEVEDDAPDDFQSAPQAPPPPRTSAEQQSSSYSQPSAPSAGAFPRNTEPSRYSLVVILLVDILNTTDHCMVWFRESSNDVMLLPCSGRQDC